MPASSAFPTSTYMQSVFETAADGIVIIDSGGIILQVNPAVGRLLGYVEGELVGQNVSLLMPQPHRSEHDQYMARYLRTGEARIIGIGREVYARHKDGLELPVRLSISEVRIGEERFFTGILHDISEVKRAEQQLRDMNAELEGRVSERTEELSRAVNRLLTTNNDLQHEIAERQLSEKKLLVIQQELQVALEKEKELGDLKSRFLTLASHEFRTPLTTILSSASLIGRYTDTESQEKREKHLDRIRNAVRSLTGLLEDFLSVGKLEEGRIVVLPEPIRLRETVQQWVYDFRDTLWKQGTLQFESACPDNFTVLIDPRILQNILLNLLSNAVKYSNEPVDIRVSLQQENADVSLCVRDSGIGIPAKDQEHLSERFFRATNAGNIQGTGLGLHIVREYALLLGGSLQFESEFGQGSVFCVTFPASKH